MEFKSFRKQLFHEGEKLGITELEIYYEKQESFSCNLFKGEIDGFDSSIVNGVSVRGISNGKMGYAYTEKLDESSVTFLLESIIENARLIEDDPGIIYSGENANYQEVDYYVKALDEVTTEEKISFLKEVEKKIYDYDERVFQTAYAALRDQSIVRAVYNSNGVEQEECNNFLHILFSVLVRDGEETKSDMYFKTTKDFSALNPDEIAKEAVEKSLRHLGEQAYPNKTYPIILDNATAATLIATFVSSFSADAVQKGQSRLKDKLNERIASEKVNLRDDPFLPNGTHSATFDSEGVPTAKLDVVKDGKLTTYFHNLKTARKDSVSSTGHGYKDSYKDTVGVSPSNFYVVPGDKSAEDLIGDLEEGILITNLAGLHSGADPISGDFSLAANGFFIKNGKVVSPTTLMTVAGNFFDVLLDIEEVAADLEFSPMGASGYIGSPSLQVNSLAVAFD